MCRSNSDPPPSYVENGPLGCHDNAALFDIHIKPFLESTIAMGHKKGSLILAPTTTSADPEIVLCVPNTANMSIRKVPYVDNWLPCWLQKRGTVILEQTIRDWAFEMATATYQGSSIKAQDHSTDKEIHQPGQLKSAFEPKNIGRETYLGRSLAQVRFETLTLYLRSEDKFGLFSTRTVDCLQILVEFED